MERNKFVKFMEWNEKFRVANNPRHSINFKQKGFLKNRPIWSVLNYLK